jgi:hypothetical protein
MVDVPRSLIDREIEERVRRDMIENRPPPSFGAGALQAFFGQGVAMGGGDEAEAWIRSKLGQGDTSSLQKNIIKEYGRFAERYPFTSGALEFAGGAAPAVAAAYLAPATGGATAPVAAAQTGRALGALGRIASSPYARSVATNVGQGAISGALTSEEGSRGEGAAGGAALGAGVGLAAPAVVRTAKSGLDWVRERAIPTDKFVKQRALGKIYDQLENEGMKPGDVLATSIDDYSMNVPSMFANASPSLVRLADAAANRAGRASAMVRNAFDELKEGSRERVMQQARTGISGRNYFQDEADAVSRLRADAKSDYDKAYAFGSVMDPRINQVLENPKFAEFFKRAQQIADNEASAAELRGQNPAQFKLQELYKIKTDKDGNMIGFEKTAVPDVRTLDYIKRGIDSVIESGFEGKGITKPEANSLKELRKAFIEAVDQATVDPKTGKSAYAEARRNFAGDMEVIDAMRVGYNDFNSLASEEVQMLMKNMSNAEKEAFRTGAVRNIYSMIMDPSNDINAGKRLVGSPEMRAKLAELFDSDAKRDLFMAAAQREREMFEQASKLLGGSPTVPRREAIDRLEEGSNFGEMVAQAINQGGFKDALVMIASRAMSKAKMTDDVAEEVAKRLLSKNPAEVAAAVRELEEYAIERAPRQTRLSATEAGVGSGTTVALPSAPPSGEQPEKIDVDELLRQLKANK